MKPIVISDRVSVRVWRLLLLLGAAQDSEGGVSLSDVECVPVTIGEPGRGQHSEGSPRLGPQIRIRRRVFDNGEGPVIIT